MPGPIVRMTIMGVTCDAFTIDTFHEFMDRVFQSEKPAFIAAHHNLHSVSLFHRDPGFRSFFDSADAIWIDGMWLVWWGRLLGLPLTRKNRVTLTHWLPAFLAHVHERRRSIYFLGGAPGVGEKAFDRFRAQLPGLSVRSRHGFFDTSANSPENSAILADIAAWQPDILLVGMGMPRQERWVLENRSRLSVPLIMTAGAAIDYYAQVKPKPPSLLGQFGLEWAFRLVCEPLRLARRYLAEPWGLLPVMWRDLRALRERSNEDEIEIL